MCLQSTVSSLVYQRCWLSTEPPSGRRGNWDRMLGQSVEKGIRSHATDLLTLCETFSCCGFYHHLHQQQHQHPYIVAHGTVINNNNSICIAPSSPKIQRHCQRRWIKIITRALKTKDQKSAYSVSSHIFWTFSVIFRFRFLAQMGSSESTRVPWPIQGGSGGEDCIWLVGGDVQTVVNIAWIRRCRRRHYMNSQQRDHLTITQSQWGICIAPVTKLDSGAEYVKS